MKLGIEFEIESWEDSGFEELKLEEDWELELTRKDGKKTTLDLDSFEKDTKIKLENGIVTIDEKDDLIGAKNVVGNEEGYTIDKVDSFERDGFVISNGINVTVTESEIYFDKADVVLNNGSIAVEVEEYNGTIGSFCCDEAEIVMKNNIIFYNVTDTCFDVFADGLEAKPGFNVTLNFIDSNGVMANFTAIGNQSSIRISNTNMYTITEGLLTIDNMDKKNYSESLMCLNKCNVTTSAFYGIECAWIIPIGTYFYNDVNILKDFVV